MKEVNTILELEIYRLHNDVRKVLDVLHQKEGQDVTALWSNLSANLEARVRRVNAELEKKPNARSATI
jgi:hypothetical protein